ncbi:acyl carrier protein [Pseudomonadota bacterium]
MMKNNELIDIIKAVLCEAAQREIDVDSKTSLLDARVIDSLTVLALVSGLEERFDIEFEDDDLDVDNFETIDTIAAMLTNRYL